MTAPDKITAWEGGTRLSLLGGAAEFQHTYHHQRTVDELLETLDICADDLQEWVDIKDSLISRGFNMDDTEQRLARARALIAKHRKGGDHRSPPE